MAPVRLHLYTVEPEGWTEARLPSLGARRTRAARALLLRETRFRIVDQTVDTLHPGEGRSLWDFLSRAAPFDGLVVVSGIRDLVDADLRDAAEGSLPPDAPFDVLTWQDAIGWRRVVRDLVLPMDRQAHASRTGPPRWAVRAHARAGGLWEARDESGALAHVLRLRWGDGQVVASQPGRIGGLRFPPGPALYWRPLEAGPWPRRR